LTISEDFYRTVCGGHLEGVLDTLVYVKRDTSVWFEITTIVDSRRERF
jgi:pyruvate formate lyase activating enzyme